MRSCRTAPAAAAAPAVASCKPHRTSRRQARVAPRHNGLNVPHACPPKPNTAPRLTHAPRSHSRLLQPRLPPAPAPASTPGCRVLLPSAPPSAALASSSAPPQFPSMRCSTSARALSSALPDSKSLKASHCPLPSSILSRSDRSPAWGGGWRVAGRHRVKRGGGGVRSRQSLK